MKPMHIAMALLSAAMFFVLAGVFMGVQLELDGTKLVVDTASEIRWQWVFIGTAVVFFFQLVRPAFQKGLKSVSGPKFILPAIDGSTVKQKLFLVALLVLAVAWPFMVSRGTVDIATLTMIYIILGLGLNVVVGLSGLLVLGYGGFYAIGAYTFALLNHYYGLGFWTCLPIAGLMAAAAGFLLGFPVLRLRGDYLAIVTLGFGEIVRILLLNNTEITERNQSDPETDTLRTRVQPYRPRRRLGHVQQFLWPEIRSLRSRHLPLPGGVAASGVKPVCH